jgi:hypothetical protein
MVAWVSIQNGLRNRCARGRLDCCSSVDAPETITTTSARGITPMVIAHRLLLGLVLSVAGGFMHSQTPNNASAQPQRLFSIPYGREAGKAFLAVYPGAEDEPYYARGHRELLVAPDGKRIAIIGSRESDTHHEYRRQMSRTPAILAIWFMLIASAPAIAEGLQQADTDARLERRITVFEPAVPLGELFKRLTREAGVVLRVDDSWQEVRVAVLTRDRPLRELMTAIAAAFPPLQWTTLQYPNQPPTYTLRYRPLSKPSAPAARAPKVARVRRVVDLVRPLLQQSPPPDSLEQNPPTSVDPKEWRTALSLYRSIYPTYIGEIEALVGLPNRYRSAYLVALHTLIHLRDSEWRLLEEHSQLVVRTAEGSYGNVDLLALWKGAESEYRNLSASPREAGESSVASVEDLLIRFWFDRDGNFQFGLIPLARQGTQWIAAGSYESFILVEAERVERPWDAEVPTLAAFEKPLPTTPEMVLSRANWYNTLGCLLLEIALATERSLVAPIFPFYAAGSGERNRLLNAAAQHSDILRFRVPAADLPKLCRSTGLRFTLQDNWLIGAHADLEGARADDISDSVLQQLFPDESPKDTAWFLQVGQQMAKPPARALPMLRVLIAHERDYSDDDFPAPPPNSLERRYELPTARDVSAFWRCGERTAFYFERPEGRQVAQNWYGDEPFYRRVWEFFFALSPGERARVLAGEPLFWGQMRPSQQRAFLEVVREHPLAWLASTLPETASFSVHWRRAPVRYPAPSAAALEAICASVNPVARYLQLYWAALGRSDAAPDKDTTQTETVLELRFAWGTGEVRYSIRRIGIWDWLQALCKRASDRGAGVGRGVRAVCAGACGGGGVACGGASGGGSALWGGVERACDSGCVGCEQVVGASSVAVGACTLTGGFGGK